MKKKIFLGNLSKGRLGDINAEVLGLFIVGKMTQAALSRADTRAGTLPMKANGRAVRIK
jgi:hypothetical protein